MANKINFEVGYSVNKAGLNEFKKDLQALQNMSLKDLIKIDSKATKSQLDSIKKSASEVQKIFDKSFNTDLGTLNATKFNNELKKLDIKQIQSSWQSAGNAGQKTFRDMTTQVLTTNVQLKETHKLLDNMATSMANTVKWGITSSIFNNVTNSIQKAWSYTKSLDTSLNDIRIVTDKSANSMERFAKQANKAAQDLGQSTKAYTEASLIYYQQGLSDEEVQARTETTLKAANVTGQTGEEVSEQLTAVWNGYQVTAEEAELYVDKLAAVAASTASDLEELSTGMSKVASAANAMGVDVDKLNGMLSTVISVTRQAPESAGTAFKTIFARMEDLKLGGTDESGATLGKVSGALASVGIQILDTEGSLRDLGEVIEEVGNKWNTGAWTEAQKQALAIELAGKRQYNNLLALFENWDMYTEAVNTSQNAVGTLQHQQDIYMESTAAHLKELSTSWERVFDALVNNDSTNNLVDGLTLAVNGLANFIEMAGGGGNVLLMLGSIGSQVFSKQIASGLATTIANMQSAKENAKTLSAQFEILQQFKGIPTLDSVTEELIGMKQEVLDLNSVISEEQMNMANAFISRRNDLENEKEEWEQLKQSAQDFYQQQTGDKIDITGVPEATGKDYKDELKNIKSEYKDVTKDANNFKNVLIDVAAANRDFLENENDEALDLYIHKIDEAKTSMKGYINLSEDLIDQDKANTNEKQALTKALEKYQQSLKETNMGDDSFAEDQSVRESALELVETYTKVGQRIRDEADKTEKVITQESAGATTRISEDIKLTQDEYDKFLKKLQQTQVIKTFVEAASAVGQLASAIQTLTSLPNIIKDEDLSAGDKATQIIMALASGIPLLLNSLKTLKDAMPALAVALKLPGISAEAGFWKATVAVLTFETALGPLWLVLLGVAAVIGTIVGVSYALVKAYNADADAAKAAQQSVEELSAAYEECKAKVTELKEAMSKYDQAVDALKDLKSNTEEYKVALEKANDEAKKLIEQYKLFDKYSFDEKGLIKIDPDALKGALTEAEKTAQRVEDSLYSAKVQAGKTSLKKQRTDFAREVGMLGRSSDNAGVFLEGTTRKSGERTTESVQLDDKSISTIVSGLNQLKQDNIEKYTKQVLIPSSEDAENKLKDVILGFDGLTPAIKENIDQIVKQRDALIALTDSTYETTKANKYYAGQLLSNVVEDKYQKQFESFATKDGKVDTALSESLGNAMKTLVKTRDERSQDGFEKKISDIDVSKVKSTKDLQKYEQYKDVKNDIDLIRTYAAEIKGIDWDTINQHVTIKSQIGKGTMTTDEGEVLIQDKSDEQMRQELAAKAEVDKIKQEYEAQNKEFNDQMAASLQDLTVDAAKFGEQYGTDFSKAILTGIANNQQSFDFSSLFGDFTNMKDVTEIAKMSGEELTQALGLSKEELTQLGFENAEHFAAAFKAGFKGYEWDLDSAITKSMENIDKEIETKGLNKKKTAEYKDEIETYAKYLGDIADQNDKLGDSGDELADTLNEDADTLTRISFNVVKMNKAIDQLAKNWDNWNDILKDNGNVGQEDAEALAGIRQALADIYDTESNLISNDFIRNHLAEIEKVAKGDETAIENLRGALSKDIAINIVAENDLGQGVQDQILSLLDNLDIPNPQIGLELTGLEGYDSFINTLEKIIGAAKMTEEQANAFLGSMGFQAKIKTVPQEVHRKGHQTITTTIPSDFQEFDTPTGKVTYPTKFTTQTTQGEEYDYTEYVDAIAMSTGDKDPQITSLKRVSSGGMSNYSSKNPGGGAPGKSGKKGGGGSKSKPKEEKRLDKKHNPYHDIDIIIKDLSHDLNMLESQQEKFFGQKLINNLNKQWELLGKSIDAYREKMRIAEGEAARLRGELSQKGVTFNADGTIANYAEAYKAQVNYVNSLIDRFNKMSAKEQEAHQKELEKAKDDFNKFEQAIGEYDKTITDLIPGLEKDIQAAVDQQIEIQIKKFNMEIDLRLNMADAEREWNDFKKKVIDDINETDILGNAKAELQNFFAYYKESGKGIIQANTQHITDVLGQLTQMDQSGWSEVYGDNRTQALDDLQKYYQQLMQDLEAVEDLSDEIHHSYLDMMDEANDKFKDQIKLYEQVSDLIEHDMKVIELVRGEKAFTELGKYYQMQEDNYNKQLDFQRQQKDFWKAQMDTLEEGSEEWEKAKENWMSAVNEWNASVEAAIENLQDKYLNAINEVFDNLNNKVTAGKGLDYVSEEWDLINRNADEYLDTINSMFEIQSLESKYLDAIDQTDSISAQKKLNELKEEEIKALREKDKLTQYDIDRANLKYEIALKQIALEEAQQNKSQMRLRRDSQGNYSYQFVADEAAVGQAEDELSVLRNDLYNLDAGQYKDKLDELLGVWTEFQEKMAEAAQINDPQERADKELLLKEQYGELINGLVEQNETIRTNLHESAFEDLAELYDVDISNFENMTEAEKDLILNDLLPQWSSGVQEMADIFAGEGGFIPTCKDAFDELDNVTKEYENDLNELESSAGVDFDSIANGLDNTINQTQDLISNNNDLINSYKNQLDAIGAVIRQLDDLILKYKIAKNEAMAATEAAYKYWAAQNEAAAQAAGRDQSNRGAHSASSNSSNSNNGNSGAATSSGGSGQGGQGDGKASVGDTATLSGSYYYDSFGTAPAGSRYSGISNGVVIDRVNNNPYGIHIHSADGKFGDLGWVRKDQLTGYDTGGYTGSWNDNNGRLALLHKKELVLNANDTTNILNAVQTLKNITDSIGSTMLSRLASMSAGTSPNANIGNSLDTIEQNVHIDATFPDVKDAREIESAIDNLINVASQKIQRNKRR